MFKKYFKTNALVSSMVMTKGLLLTLFLLLLNPISTHAQTPTWSNSLVVSEGALNLDEQPLQIGDSVVLEVNGFRVDPTTFASNTFSFRSELLLETPYSLENYVWPVYLANAVNGQGNIDVLMGECSGLILPPQCFSALSIEGIASNYRNAVWLSDNLFGTNVSLSVERRDTGYNSVLSFGDFILNQNHAPLKVGDSIRLNVSGLKTDSVGITSTFTYQSDLVLSTAYSLEDYVWPIYLANQVNAENNADIMAGECNMLILAEVCGLVVPIEGIASSYRNQLWVSDDIAGVTATLTVNTAPVFTSTPTTSVGTSTIYSYQVTADPGQNSSKVNISAETIPSWLRLSNSNAVQTSTYLNTNYTWRIEGLAQHPVTKELYMSITPRSGQLVSQILKSSPGNTYTIFVGNRDAGYADGVGTQAKFNGANELAFDKYNNLYVADSGNHRIRKVTPDGTVTTVAGSGIAGFQDGSSATAQFNLPFSIYVDNDDNIYVGDRNNYRIRKISPQGTVSTIVGNGINGIVNGPAAQSEIGIVYGLTMDKAGNLYFSDFEDSGLNRIGKLSTDGIVSTVADLPGYRGVWGVDVDQFGNIYTAIYWGGHILKITPEGVVSTLTADPNGFARAVVANSSENSLYYTSPASGDIKQITLGTPTFTLQGTPYAGFTGTNSVILKATNENGGSSNQKFTITVN